MNKQQYKLPWTKSTFEKWSNAFKNAPNQGVNIDTISDPNIRKAFQQARHILDTIQRGIEIGIVEFSDSDTSDQVSYSYIQALANEIKASLN